MYSISTGTKWHINSLILVTALPVWWSLSTSSCCWNWWATWRRLEPVIDNSLGSYGPAHKLHWQQMIVPLMCVTMIISDQCVCVCVYVCMWVYTHTHACTHARTHTHTHMYTHTHARTHTHTHTCTHIPGSASSNFSFKRGNAGLRASGNCQDKITTSQTQTVTTNSHNVRITVLYRVVQNHQVLLKQH